MPLIWVLVALCAVAGGGLAALGVLGARGAPQEAAAAAVGLGLAVIPYVFARALGALSALTRDDVRDAVAAALRSERADEPPRG